MYIYFPRAAIDLGSNELGHIYALASQEPIEVDDRFVERRSGQHSAILHIKPLADIHWSGNLPTDAIQSGRLFARKTRGGPVEYLDTLNDDVWSPRMAIVTFNTTEGPCTAVLTLSVQRTVSGFRMVSDTSRFYWPTGQVNYLRCRQYYSFSDWQAVDRSGVVSENDLILLARRATAFPTSYDRVERHDNHTTLPFPDLDYVNRLVSLAFAQAEQFDDTRLVVGSWGPKSVAPSDVRVLAGMANSYIDALDDIPRFSDNELQNIAAIAKDAIDLSRDPVAFLRNLVKTRSNESVTYRRYWFSYKASNREWFSSTRIKKSKWLPDLHFNEFCRADTLAVYTAAKETNWKTLWLRGRYAWATYWMDAEMHWNFLLNKMAKFANSRSRQYKCHGKVERDSVTFQCTFVAKERVLTGLNKLVQKLYYSGCEPNAYVIWDCIPYSFVVDWFIPIGNTAHALTKASHAVPEYWEYLPVYGKLRTNDDQENLPMWLRKPRPETYPKSFCYSMSYESETVLGRMSVYTRWYEASPPDIELGYVLSQTNPVSEKTFVMRVLDGIALFVI